MSSQYNPFNQRANGSGGSVWVTFRLARRADFTRVTRHHDPLTAPAPFPTLMEDVVLGHSDTQ